MLNMDESESLSESSCSSDEEVGPKKRFTIERENERFKSEVSYSSGSELNGSNSSDEEVIPWKRPCKEFTESDEDEIREQKEIMTESEELEQENSSSSDYEEAVPKTNSKTEKDYY